MTEGPTGQTSVNPIDHTHGIEMSFKWSQVQTTQRGENLGHMKVDTSGNESKRRSIVCRYVLLSPEPSNLRGDPYPDPVEVRHRGTECLGLIPDFATFSLKLTSSSICVLEVNMECEVSDFLQYSELRIW